MLDVSVINNSPPIWQVYPTEVLVGLCVTCEGESKEILKFIHSLFNFHRDAGGGITYDEFGLLVSTAGTAVLKAFMSDHPSSSSGGPPSNSEAELQLKNSRVDE